MKESRTIIAIRKVMVATAAISGVIFGLAMGVLIQFMAQKIVFPLFGIHVSNVDHFWIAVAFDVLSILRSLINERILIWTKRGVNK